MKLTEWWSCPDWLAYEAAYGEQPGTRADLLASATWKTRVIDLRQPVPELWRGVRRSYHAIINGYNDPNMVAILSGPGASNLIKTCQRVHFLDSDKVTRPEATWHLMVTWADQGKGVLVMSFDHDAPPTGMQYPWPPCSGFAYFIVYKNWAYYASAATLGRNINHALMWEAMKYLRGRVRWLEVGWQGAATDDKGRNIEFFRRGFGGEDMDFATILED